MRSDHLAPHIELLAPASRPASKRNACATRGVRLADAAAGHDPCQGIAEVAVPEQPIHQHRLYGEAFGPDLAIDARQHHIGPNIDRLPIRAGVPDVTMCLNIRGDIRAVALKMTPNGRLALRNNFGEPVHELLDVLFEHDCLENPRQFPVCTAQDEQTWLQSFANHLIQYQWVYGTSDFRFELVNQGTRVMIAQGEFLFDRSENLRICSFMNAISASEWRTTK